MKVWKQKLAAAVLAGMLLGAGCTEELDPRPPSAELTEEELLEIQQNAAAAEEIAKKVDDATERARSIGADEATAEIVQRAQEKVEAAEAKINSATNRVERQEAKRSLTAAEDAIRQAEEALTKAEQDAIAAQEKLKDPLPKMLKQLSRKPEHWQKKPKSWSSRLQLTGWRRQRDFKNNQK